VNFTPQKVPVRPRPNVRPVDRRQLLLQPGDN
jgi:hypothetical protein